MTEDVPTVAGSIPLVCMSTCPRARYWTPNCSWWSAPCMAATAISIWIAVINYVGLAHTNLPLITITFYFYCSLSLLAPTCTDMMYPPLASLFDKSMLTWRMCLQHDMFYLFTLPRLSSITCRSFMFRPTFFGPVLECARTKRKAWLMVHAGGMTKQCRNQATHQL